jgi:hypothetical protein
MTLSYYPEELPYVPGEWPAAAPQALFAAPRRRPDAMTLAGAFLLAFLLLQVMLDRSSSLPAAAASGADAAVPALELAPAQPESAAAPPENSAAPLPPEAGPLPQKVEVASPYDSYTLTQGPHGFSYGHMAVDLHAGEGEVIRSPIDGAVTARYVDQWGNPALVVENATRSPCCTATTSSRWARSWPRATRWATRATRATPRTGPASCVTAGRAAASTPT